MFEHSFCVNPFAYLRDMLTSLFWAFDYSTDEDYRAERRRANEFSQHLGAEAGTLLCDIAREKLRNKVESLNRLDDKRDSFAKFSAGMIVFLAAASKAFAFPLFPFVEALVCFLLSSIVFMLSRRVIDVPSIAPIQDLRVGIGQVTDARDWVAASLHKACAGYTRVEKVVAHQINFGLFWVIAGLVLVICVALGFQPTQFISS